VASLNATFETDITKMRRFFESQQMVTWTWLCLKSDFTLKIIEGIGHTVMWPNHAAYGNRLSNYSTTAPYTSFLIVQWCLLNVMNINWWLILDRPYRIRRYIRRDGTEKRDIHWYCWCLLAIGSTGLPSWAGVRLVFLSGQSVQNRLHNVQ
jgi:hypothetical protein